MSDETITKRPHDATLDRATEEYLRALAAGQSPEVKDFVEKYGGGAADLEDFARDYRRLAEALGRNGPRSGLATPTFVKQFGDYDLDGEPLGRGGMGVVYKARQISLERTVAIKLILTGALATPGEIRRFYEEARVAAGLHHRHIVAIHEVGCIEGQHFYSMDYVEGYTLDALVDGQGPLAPRVAAEFLLAAAEAVAYAHSKGVIHRDLKPSNILVDADNQLRLTDFGLAKQLRDDSQATATLGILGTPSYMAPEQARGDVAAVGERSDVYGLGAVLYKLLTGAPPFLGASPLDILRQVAAEEPLPPRSLNAQLPIDLETICLTCLQKDPSSRYSSAKALVDDLARYLNQEPIEARPIGRVRRVAMWAKRRPVVASLGALLAVSLSVGFAGVLTQYMRAEAALMEAQQNLERAETNLASAIAALEFVGHEVGEVELAGIPRVQALQRRILERAVEFNEKLLNANSSDPRAQWESGQAFLRIAGLQTTLGDYDSAERAYHRAIEVIESIEADDESGERTQAQLTRAQFSLANLMIDAHRFPEADRLIRTLEKSSDESSETAGSISDRLELLAAQRSLEGRLLLHEGRFDEAQRSFRESVTNTEQLIHRVGANDQLNLDLAQRYLSLGVTLRKSGETPAAVQAYQRAIDLFQKLGSDVHLGTAWRDLGIAYRKQGEFTKAIAAYDEARTKIAALVQFSPDSVKLRSEFAETIHGIALCHLARGEGQEAIPFLKEAIDAQKAVIELTPDVVDYRLRLRNELFTLTHAYLETKMHDEASGSVEEFLKFAIAPVDFVNAALALVACKAVVELDVKMPEERRRETADAYALRAISVLTDAMERGLINAQSVATDARLSPLNAYEGFKSLLQTN